MGQNNLKAAVLLRPENIYYVSGIWGQPDPGKARLFAVVITEEKECLVLPLLETWRRGSTWIKDFRIYEEYSKDEGSGKLMDPVKALAKALEELGLQEARIGLEEDFVSIKLHRQVSTILKDARFDDVSPLLSSLRIVKSPEEIAMARKAAQRADRGMASAMDAFGSGLSEREVDIEVRKTMMKEEGYWTVAPHIPGSPGIAIGEHTTFPHWRASETKSKEGDIVKADLCAVSYHCGYFVGMGRCAVIGKASSQVRKIYDTVLRASEAVKKLIKPGVKASTLDRTAHIVIEEAGLGQYYARGTGRGVGLTFYERPLLRIYDETALEPGMIFSVEPAVCIPGIGGPYVEDTIVVTGDGYESLTTYSRELRELRGGRQ